MRISHSNFQILRSCLTVLKNLYFTLKPSGYLVTFKLWLAFYIVNVSKSELRLWYVITKGRHEAFRRATMHHKYLAIKIIFLTANGTEILRFRSVHICAPFVRVIQHSEITYFIWYLVVFQWKFILALFRKLSRLRN